MSTRRRYEILLPLRFNDGRDVPDELLWKTVEELERRFQGVSLESQVIHGLWRGEGISYHDNNTRLIVDVDDSPENRAFFVALKARLKRRFKQVEIYIVSHQIEVL
jgi:hypothetical protein